LKEGFQVRGSWIDKGDDDKEENGEIVVIKDDTFFEAETFLIFALKKSVFNLGVVMVMELVKGPNEEDFVSRD